ncbi:MAG: nitronate monooxygenase [Paraglaciecola sp.]|uniref:NAD(P)H-dependent flavin oxidoreductase n=1 Tax=Paraglaciecola sp. TaxID=1920173 RepID=UPI00329918B8
MHTSNIERAEKFAIEMGMKCPVLLGPMAGACPVGLSIAVAKGGGMGACGALLMQPDAIKQWAAEFRAATDGPFQLNLWIPDAAPRRNASHENELRAFLRGWGPEVSTEAAIEAPPDFESQCHALLEVEPPVISSIMGLFDAYFVKQMKAKGIKWYANVTTVAEAIEAEAAGADVVVAKSFEAGGHSGAFKPEDATRFGVGAISLVPAIANAVDLPIVATGGIADGRTAAAVLLLGASAVQIGTGFLRATESTIPSAWSEAIANARPEDTIVTKAYSGRAGRSIATKYAIAMEAADSPEPAPYPIQRGLTQVMRTAAVKENRIESMQAWAGQSAGMAQSYSATKITQEVWNSVRAALGS